MKILICSKLFYPSNAIGAVRPSNFAKYLAKYGHDITVITDETKDKEAIVIPRVEIIRISNSRTVDCLTAKTKNFINAKNTKKKFPIDSNLKNSLENKKNSILLKFNHFYRTSRAQIYHLFIEIDWFRRAKRTTREKYATSSFDIVISSFGPIGSFLLGYYVSKSRIARHWISDLRDNMPDNRYPFWLNIIYKISERKTAHSADAIILVSQGQALMLNNSLKDVYFDRNKIHVISNGYENKFEPVSNEKKDKILRILYTGQLYSKSRDFRLLFEVLSDLIKEKLIDLNKVILTYVGPDSVEFKKQLYRFTSIKEICQDLGFVDRNFVLKIQKNSDILVALTWNNKDSQGILTGKFMEYLQAYKPIISITSGNLPNGELSQIIKKLNLGLACEYITCKKDHLLLREYLLTQYNRIQEGKPLLFNPDLEWIQRFHYENLTMELEGICMNIYNAERTIPNNSLMLKP
jgi:glycosyltransferase involved in cell wall biosynthesis